MVTVIIPVYNVERYLARCLDSVLGQTVRDIEVICVDDASGDSSASIADGYSRRDARVRVLRQGVNAGQGAARNRGLDEAHGEYFTFVDADDAIHPQFLEVMLSVMERAKTPIAVDESFERFEGRDGCGKLDAVPFSRTFSFRSFVRDRRIFSSVWNKLYSREIVGDVRFLSHPFEDWPYLVKVFAKARTYAKFSAPLYFYNDENVSTVRSPFGEKKINGYLTGIADVTRAFRGGELERDVRRRAAVGAKMLMSKARKCEAPLRRMAAQGLAGIIAEGLLSPADLDFKTRYRLWRMRREAGL